MKEQPQELFYKLVCKNYSTAGPGCSRAQRLTGPSPYDSQYPWVGEWIRPLEGRGAEYSTYLLKPGWYRINQPKSATRAE